MFYFCGSPHRCHIQVNVLLCLFCVTLFQSLPPSGALSMIAVTQPPALV